MANFPSSDSSSTPASTISRSSSAGSRLCSSSQPYGPISPIIQPTGMTDVQPEMAMAMAARPAMVTSSPQALGEISPIIQPTEISEIHAVLSEQAISPASSQVAQTSH